MVVDGNAAKDFIEDNDEPQEWYLTWKENQHLEMPIYYVGLDIVKPHVVSCTLGKYIPYYWHLLVILWPPQVGWSAKVGNLFQFLPCSK